MLKIEKVLKFFEKFDTMKIEKVKKEWNIELRIFSMNICKLVHNEIS